MALKVPAAVLLLAPTSRANPAVALLVPAVARVRAGQQRRRTVALSAAAPGQQLRSVADVGAAPAAPDADLRATPMPTAGLQLAPFRRQRLRRPHRRLPWHYLCRRPCHFLPSYASIWVCIGSNPSYTNI